jgi:hypothetical protein
VVVSEIDNIIVVLSAAFRRLGGAKLGISGAGSWSFGSAWFSTVFWNGGIVIYC